MNILTRNAEARNMNGRVSRNETLRVCTIIIQRRKYGTSEVINCQTLFDILGLLYLVMIDCHDICVVFTILGDMIIKIH